MLTLSNICRTYQVGPIDVDVLKGVDLHVDKGELLSIMGTSGCGKSTLMNIIGLLDQPTSGEYHLDGREVSALNDDMLSEIRNNKIGFVFQSFYLLSKLSATDNVGVPLIYRGMPKKEIAERAYAYLEKVGMHERGHHRPNELSGGQQQRVAIARSLAGQPAILLADEPTGALDPNVGQEIMELFVRLNEEEGITIIIITHDPGVARQCKRRVEVKDGVIVEG